MKRTKTNKINNISAFYLHWHVGTRSSLPWPVLLSHMVSTFLTFLEVGFFKQYLHLKCRLWVFDELGVDVWVHGGRSTGAWLLSTFILFQTRYVRYFMAIYCMWSWDSWLLKGVFWVSLGPQVIVCVQLLIPMFWQ